jgi:ferric-dicitrate binding protein FerR (iron transport regulator)
MDEFPRPLTAAETVELRRRQRGKNLALFAALLALALLFYAISMVKFKVS